jgi:aspartyl-tRNA(Asn)/glutamyl-tRNA(Gln) amidotransferase subunit B
MHCVRYKAIYLCAGHLMSNITASLSQNTVMYACDSGTYYVHIGLEIHCQIKSERKLFSWAPVGSSDAGPNQCVSFVDIAAPGMLPVLNRHAVAQGIRMGIALNGTVNPYCIFDRKHYFYPDNPSGYQISQHHHPLIEHGKVVIQVKDSVSTQTYSKTIRVQRLHLEQDAGKSMHDSGSGSLIDFNRAGVGLMEIVSHPDLSSPEEAASYVEHVQRLARHSKASDADMEKGQMRVDVNISVSRSLDQLGVRSEIKNMNSVRFLKAALYHEIQRHIEHIQDGTPLKQETRGFDPKKGATFSMRSKEKAEDYRYFPDPDLPRVHIDASWVAEIRAQMPELFEAKCARFMDAFQLSAYDSQLLCDTPEVADFFEATERAFPKAHQKSGNVSKLSANWITGALFASLQDKSNIAQEVKFSPTQYAEFIVCVAEKIISTPVAKEIFQEMLQNGGSVSDIMKEKGIEATPLGAQDFTQIIEEVCQENAGQVAQYLAGKDKLFMFFVGQTMKKLQGRGNPEDIQHAWRTHFEAQQ